MTSLPALGFDVAAAVVVGSAVLFVVGTLDLLVFVVLVLALIRLAIRKLNVLVALATNL